MQGGNGARVWLGRDCQRAQFCDPLFPLVFQEISPGNLLEIIVQLFQHFVAERRFAVSVPFGLQLLVGVKSVAKRKRSMFLAAFRSGVASTKTGPSSAKRTTNIPRGVLRFLYSAMASFRFMLHCTAKPECRRKNALIYVSGSFRLKIYVFSCAGRTGLLQLGLPRDVCDHRGFIQLHEVRR